MKCVFNSYECEGKLTEFLYEKPFKYWNWPIIYCCEYHENIDINWKDALNTRSNVLTSNAKMTHTKEFSPLQGLEFFVGNCEKIVLCDRCNGTGEEGYSMLPKLCKKCNGTGRDK